MSDRDLGTLKDHERSKHYSVICRTDVEPNFRRLAAVGKEEVENTLIVLLEGLFCGYLNTVKTTPGPHNPPPAIA